MTRKNTRRHFVYHTHNSLSGRYFRPTVERLEHRFPPGDIGITGPLVFAEGSQLALELRSDYDNATLFNSRPEEWRGEGRISLFPSADEAAYTISPLPQGSPSSDLSVTGDESVYGLAAIEAPGIRHVMQSARPSLPVTHVSAESRRANVRRSGEFVSRWWSSNTDSGADALVSTKAPRAARNCRRSVAGSRESCEARPCLRGKCRPDRFARGFCGTNRRNHGVPDAGGSGVRRAEFRIQNSEFRRQVASGAC